MSEKTIYKLNLQIKAFFVLFLSLRLVTFGCKILTSFLCCMKSLVELYEMALGEGVSKWLSLCSRL